MIAETNKYLNNNVLYAALKSYPRSVLCILCVFMPNTFSSVGSTDQFEEILSQYEELKVT